jgi:hypothetical protein
MNQPCDESNLWWKIPVVPTLNRPHKPCHESTLQRVDSSINWPFDESTRSKLTKWWINLQWIDLAMNRLCNEATRHKLTYNELTLRLINSVMNDESIYDESTLLWTDPVMNRSCDDSTCNKLAMQLKDSAIDRLEMNQTAMNRSCKKSTLQWVGEKFLWFLRWINFMHPAMTL